MVSSNKFSSSGVRTKTTATVGWSVLQKHRLVGGDAGLDMGHYVDRSGCFFKYLCWLADIKQSRLPDEIIVFIEDKPITSSIRHTKRQDVSKRFKNEKIKMSGYRISIPLEHINNNSKVQVIAISGDRATELRYNDKALENVNWRITNDT